MKQTIQNILWNGTKSGLIFPFNRRNDSPLKNKHSEFGNLLKFFVAKFNQYYSGNNHCLLKTAGRSSFQIKIFKVNSIAWLEICCSFILPWFFSFKIYIWKFVASNKQIVKCYNTFFTNFTVNGRAVDD